MVLYSSQPGILIEIRNTIDLMALARSEALNGLSGVLVRPVGRWSQNIEIHTGVVQQTWLLGELTLVVKPIHLSALSVGSVGLLLDFVRGLSEGSCVLPLGEGDS